MRKIRMGLVTQITGMVRGWTSPPPSYSPVRLAPTTALQVTPLSPVLRATTNQDPHILAAAYSLGGPNPSPILAGALAWCHQRGFLREATEALRDFGVPLEHVRKPTQDLKIGGFLHKDNPIVWEKMRRFMALANEIGIPRHHWLRAYEIFGPLTDYRGYLGDILNFESGLDALRKASVLGLGRRYLVQGALHILMDGSVERVAKILAAHLEKPEGSLKEKFNPPPDEPPPFGLAEVEIKKIGPKGLEILPTTSILPSEWYSLTTKIRRQGIPLPRYVTSLKKWEGAGFHWKEHFFFYVLLGVRNRDLDSNSLKRLKGKFGVQATSLSTLENLARGVLNYGKDHPKATWQTAIQKASYILEENERASYTVYPSFGGLTVFGFNRQDNGHPQKRFFCFYFSIPPKPIFDFADYSSRAEVWLVGGILYIELLQCDQRAFSDWESSTLAIVENWGRQNGATHVVINTPYAILGQAGTLASASIHNLLDVYFYFPQSHGFTLQQLNNPPEEPVMRSHFNAGAPSDYYWVKEIL